MSFFNVENVVYFLICRHLAKFFRINARPSKCIVVDIFNRFSFFFLTYNFKYHIYDVFCICMQLKLINTCLYFKYKDKDVQSKFLLYLLLFVFNNFKIKIYSMHQELTYPLICHFFFICVNILI